MRVLVVGATGNLGTALLRRLAAEPRVEVTGVARRVPVVGARVPAPYDLVSHWVGMDIGAPGSAPRLTDAMAGMDAVVHLGWAIQPSHQPDLLARTNVEGSLHVADAVRQAGVRHLVYLSSVGAYAAGPKDREVDESWPTTGVPASSYSRHKAAVERMLDRMEDEMDKEAPEVTVTRFRPALVFQRDAASEVTRYFLGPLVPLGLLLPQGRGLLPVLPMDRRLVFQAVHADDVAEAIVAAIVRRAGGPFNLAAEPAVTPADLAALLQARLVPVDVRLLRAGAAASWRLRLQPSEPGWVDLALHAPLLSTRRAQQELGWKPTRGALAAVEELLAGMAAHADAPSPPMRRRTSPV